VVLTSQPATDVVITVVSGDLGEATVDMATLTFTNSNWNTVQTVTVTGIADSTVDGDQTTIVTLSIDDANSADAFDALADQAVTVVTTDVDVAVAGFTVTQTGGTTSVSESGTTDTFDVVLTSQPATDVVITVVSGDVGEATVDQATLTFTNSNWNTVQTVTVTGVDDAAADGDQTSTITISVDGANSDNAFDSAASQTVSVVTADNELLPKPTLTGPTGASNNRRPTVTWEAVAGAESYQVRINQLGSPNTIAFRQLGISGTLFTLSANLPENGRFIVWVRAHSSQTSSVYSEPLNFSVGSVPGVTILTAPIGNTVAQPAFQWSPVAGATQYDLWVNQVRGTVRIIREQTLTGTSFTPTSSLPQGEYKAWIRAANDVGNGLRTSAPITFTVGTPPGSVSVTAPSGVSTARPAFQWTAANGATAYELWVNQVGGTIRIVHETSVVGTAFNQASDLPSGSYRTWVRAISSAGIRGPWSSAVPFTI